MAMTEEEFFGVKPTAFLDDIINCSDDYISDLADVAEETLLREMKAKISAKEVEEGVDKFRTILQAAADKNLDTFELYVLKNILYIPADVSLGQPATQSLFSEQDEKQLDEELEQLRAKITALEHKKVEMQQSLTSLQVDISHYEEVVPLLENISKECSVDALTSSVKQMEEKVKAVEAKCKETRSTMQTENAQRLLRKRVAVGDASPNRLLKRHRAMIETESLSELAAMLC
eukprot:GILJ01010047.1.p1 GENE.GILJ01010047.1~~GILJ01010047.1.p1  ORF type:complete len:260 (-),score=47.41 GILJ01010047.1:328-1023(-)